LHWVARKNDGNFIRQFDEDGEHYFWEVEKAWEENKIISVGYYSGDKYYLASLVTGNFYFPDRVIITEKALKKRKPILRREHTIVGDEHTTKYIFGFDDGKVRYEADVESRKVEKKK